MTGADAIEIDVRVVRREPPPGPPPFDCAVCGRTVAPDLWQRWKRWPDFDRPPVCNACVRHWSNLSRLRYPRCSRDDMAALHRLSAMLNALNWEIWNGRYGKRRLAW